MHTSGPPMSQWLSGGVYLVTDDTQEDEQIIKTVEQSLRGGVRCVQLRDKHRCIRELYRLAARLRALTSRMGAGLIINDRIDLALAVAADGVHIGQDDMPPRDARRLLGAQRVLGVSADSPERARRAVAEGADYLGVGHVFGSISKEKSDPPIGIEGLRAVCETARVPVVAIGAISTGNATSAIESGASSVAVISALSRADNPENTARELSSNVRDAYERRKSAQRRLRPLPPQPARAGSALETLRNQRPLIQMITNYVVMNDTATAVRLLGALPVMAEAEEEVGEMVRQARALLLNTGTPVRSRVRAMQLAAESASRAGVPVVLDPVGCGATGYRVQINQTLARGGTPAIVRGNAAEVAALIGRRMDIRGVEHTGEDNESYHKARIALARAAASQLSCVVAVSGPVDVVSDGRSTVPRTGLVQNGVPLLASVVGTGCIVSSLIAAFATVESDPFLAALWGFAVLGVAAERAAREIGENGAGRPIRFKEAVLDHLHILKPDELAEGVRLESLDQ